MAKKKKRSMTHSSFKLRPRKFSEVEDRTGRIVSMRTETNLASLRIKVNKQRTSRFFGLPPEIRLRIYEFVFHEYQDPAEAYKTTAAYFRPAYEGRQRTDTTMLLTCRRVWLEANSLPLKLSRQAFWFFNGPLDLARLKQGAAVEFDIENDNETKRIPSEVDRYQDFFRRLTPLNRLRLNHVHLFASQPWLENRLDVDTMFQVEWFHTKILTITIRHSEWGVWTGLKANNIDTSWLMSLLDSPNLRDIRNLRLELEMIEAEEEILEAITSYFSNLRGRYFKRRGNIVNHQWARPLAFSSKQLSLNEQSSCQTLYATRTITWQSIRSHQGLRKHPKGYWICDWELEDFRSERQRFLAKRRKRGGRRSKPVCVRYHWQPKRLSKKEMEKQDEAAAHMEHWTQEGSLLRLV